MVQRPSDLFPLALNGLRVGISGAIPERKFWGDVEDLDRLILTFVSQLSALVVRYGGRVVHGCQPLLTPVVAEQCHVRGAAGEGSLTLVASQLFGEIPEVARRAADAVSGSMIITRKQGEGTVRDAETRNKSLTAMRLVLTREIDVLVAIGGKLHVETGFNPGVFEELAMARWHGVPAFVVGAFGGVAGELESTLVQELSRGNLMDEGEDGPREMARWHESMDEYVGKLLAHFVRHQGRFQWRRLKVARFGMMEEEEVFRSGAGSHRVVRVDPEMVDAWSSRFGELRGAAERRDIARARGMLFSGVEDAV
jgi:hypothetical protein